MKKIIFSLILIVVINLMLGGYIVQAKQYNSKPNVTVLKFSGQMHDEHKSSVSDRLLTQLVKSNRFNVIDRKNLDKIIEEQKFSATGLVSEETGAKIGKILGLDKLVVGKIVTYNSKYHKAEYANGEKIQDAYYDIELKATVKMLNVETAKYDMAISGRGVGTGENKSRAIDNALDRLVTDIYKEFEDEFQIKAKILDVEDRVVLTLNKGSSKGIKKGMSFQIYDQKGLSGEKVAIAKVFKVKDDLAKVRVFGDFEQVKEDYFAVEAKRKVNLRATIVKRDWRSVTLNMGKNMGVKVGEIYEVKSDQGEKIVDPTTGEVLGKSQENRGLIYITESHFKYSKGKIVKGAFSIKKGLPVKQARNRSVKYKSIKSFIASQPLSIKTNTYFDNNEDGNYDKYSTKEHTTSGNIKGITYSNYSIATDLNYSLSGMLIDIPLTDKIKSNYSTGTDSLGMFMLKGSVDYYIPLIPSKLYVYPGVGVGIGYMTQSAIPPSYYSYDKVTGMGFLGLIQGGMQLNVGRFYLFAEAGYNFININSWDYEDEDSNSDNNITADNGHVPYPEISFNQQPAFKLGFGFLF